MRARVPNADGSNIGGKADCRLVLEAASATRTMRLALLVVGLLRRRILLLEGRVRTELRLGWKRPPLPGRLLRLGLLEPRQRWRKGRAHTSRQATCALTCMRRRASSPNAARPNEQQRYAPERFSDPHTSKPLLEVQCRVRRCTDSIAPCQTLQKSAVACVSHLSTQARAVVSKHHRCSHDCQSGLQW